MTNSHTPYPTPAITTRATAARAHFFHAPPVSGSRQSGRDFGLGGSARTISVLLPPWLRASGWLWLTGFQTLSCDVPPRGRRPPVLTRVPRSRSVSPRRGSRGICWVLLPRAPRPPRGVGVEDITARDRASANSTQVAYRFSGSFASARSSTSRSGVGSGSRLGTLEEWSIIIAAKSLLENGRCPRRSSA